MHTACQIRQFFKLEPIELGFHSGDGGGEFSFQLGLHGWIIDDVEAGDAECECGSCETGTNDGLSFVAETLKREFLRRQVTVNHLIEDGGMRDLFVIISFAVFDLDDSPDKVLERS